MVYIPSIQHNLIPPFIIREAGVIVNDVPKIHCQVSTKDDHAIIFSKDDLRTPLKLFGVFSYFYTFVPTAK